MENELELPDEAIDTRIHWVRGQKVMVAEDLAKLYDVPTKRLNEQVKRDPDRFSEDFLFVLEQVEWQALRSQTATLKGRGGRRYPPMVFTDCAFAKPSAKQGHGVLVLSSILTSERAVAVNIRIMRVFVRMNRILENDQELLIHLVPIVGRREGVDEALGQLFEAVRQLMEKPAGERKRLGYRGGDHV